MVGPAPIAYTTSTEVTIQPAQLNPLVPHDDPPPPLLPPIPANKEIFFSVSGDWQAGHGGASVRLSGTSSSNSLPQSLHRYS